MPAPPVGDWVDLFSAHASPYVADVQVGPIAPETLHRAKAGYYGHMTHIDHQINRFLETLVDYNVSDNTYICFTADHGESLGEHGYFFHHGEYTYDDSLRIPLVAWRPGHVPAGRVVDAPVSTVQVCDPAVVGA